MMVKNVSWKEQPDDHDYPAAAAYLSLLAEDELVKNIIADLQNAPRRTAETEVQLRRFSPCIR